MSRARKTLVAATAVVAMLASACSTLRNVGGGPSTPGIPDPTNSILLSVPSDTVYMVDPDTGAVAVVTSNLTDFQAGYASWAPNHSRYAYGQAGIMVGKPGSSTVATVVKGQLISMPSWSGTGKQIVYGNGTGMFIKTLGQGRSDHVLLPSDPASAMAPFSFDWGKGHTIAFEGLTLDCEGTPTCMSANDSDIYTVDTNGSDVQRLTKVRTATNPKWSADYSRILFVRQVGKKKKIGHQVWTVNADGTHVSRLMDEDNVVAADWSPDGKRLVVVRTAGTTAASQLQVWVGSADGTGMHMLVDGITGADASVDW
jgi:Tol biopolymer transport system component